MYCICRSFLDWFDYVYQRPYARISPYLIGMIVGYIMWKTDRKVHMPKVHYCTVRNVCNILISLIFTIKFQPWKYVHGSSSFWNCMLYMALFYSYFKIIKPKKIFQKMGNITIDLSRNIIYSASTAIAVYSKLIITCYHTLFSLLFTAVAVIITISRQFGCWLSFRCLLFLIQCVMFYFRLL